jgi:hypothetical protein
LLDGREKATNLFSAVSWDQRLARPRMDVPNVQRLSIADERRDFQDLSELKIRIRFPEGKPNLEAHEDIKMTD